MKPHTFFCLLFGMICLSSCELIDNLINPDKNDCVLQKTVWDLPADPAKVITEFTYDANGKLKEINRVSWDRETTPNYYEQWEISGSAPDKITCYAHLPELPKELEIEYHLFYNGDLPDSIFYQYGPVYNNQTGYFKARYNASNQLVQLIDNRYQQFTQTWSITTNDLEWTGNNLTRMTTLDYLGSTTIREYEYDDKKRPLIQPGLAFSNYGELTMLSSNNVKKSSRRTLNGTTTTVENVITYNHADYPIKIDPDNDHPTTFEYSCK